MDSLIAELEQAEEGSRELDAKIALAVHPLLADAVPDPERGVGHWVHPEYGKTYAIHYTTNLQDALGLVPEGMGYVVSDADWSTARASVAWKNTPLNFDAPKFDVRAATPALALTIAALKARRET